MTTIGDAFVRVRPDLDGFQEETSRGIGGTLAGVAKAGAAALATAGAAATGFGVKAVMAASDLGESVSKVNVVFGDSAAAVLDWGKSTEGTLLLSEQQALDAAGTFGNLFTSFGMGQEGAAMMSGGLVQLAQDLSSFNNIPVEEALDALRAGMTGETEPLKRLGAAFSAAELEAKAMSMGLVEQGGELDNAAKAQAAYALIMERTTNAQGDAARTADGLANQLKILKADAMDTMAGLGEALLPVATTLVSSLGGLLDDVAPVLAGVAEDIAPIISGLVEAIGPLVERMGPALGQVFGVLADVLEAIPWDMVVAAVGNIMDAVVMLLPPLQAALTPVLQAIGVLLPPISAVFTMIAETLAALLLPVVEALAPLLLTLAGVIDTQLNAVLEQLWPILTEVGAQIGGLVAEAVLQLTPLILELLDALLPLLPPLLDLTAALLPLFAELLRTMLPIVTGLLTVVLDLVLKGLEPLVGAISDVIGWVTDVITSFTDWLTGLDDFWTTLTGWVDDVKGAFSDVFDSVVGWVEDALDGLAGFFDGVWEGIKGVINTIIRAWNGLDFTIPKIDPPGPGPTFGPWTIGLPDIPELATGALVRGSTLAVIGDRPEGEAVLTRPQLREVLDWAGVRGPGGGGVTFTGPVTFGSDMRQAVQELDWWARYSMGAAAA